MKHKMFRIVLVFVVLGMASIACDDTNDVPDVGEKTLDSMAEDAVDTVEAGAGALCAACTLVNGEGSDSCTGVCK